MKTAFSILFLIIFLNLPTSAQAPINWKILADIKFAYTFVEAENRWSSSATFGEQVKALEGKEIEVKGYLLPVEIDGEMVVLSEFPFSSLCSSKTSLPFAPKDRFL